VDQDRAEHRFLGVEVVRKRARRCGEIGQGMCRGKEKALRLMPQRLEV
jgi:hypothetical protein